jgi:uncharacterized protein YfdQ (DUF2303 family)
MADMNGLKDIADRLATLGGPCGLDLEGGGRYAVVPEGYELRDLEKFLNAPLRQRADVTATDFASFCAYVSRFKNENTMIFADAAIVAIIDYHAPNGDAGFREHRVTYQTPKSLEWQKWQQMNTKRMGQESFAQFIEDNQVDIAFPVGAEILEVSRSLSAHKAVEFVSSISLADGSRQLTFNEKVDEAVTRGNIKVPEEFVLGIPVHFGGQKYDVRARLRYRIEQGKLSMWYDLYRPEYIEVDAFRVLTAKIVEATGVPLLLGKP